MDVDYAPLSQSCVKLLSDKIYEKRRNAAAEIDSLVRTLKAKQNFAQIEQLVSILAKEFALNSNPNLRKGGVLGLAATSIALGKESQRYSSLLVQPILNSFRFDDLWVRYYAAEALYNVVKVIRIGIMPHFTETFNGIGLIFSDSEQNVRNAAVPLDRILKEVVSEAPTFDLEDFVFQLRERVYSTNSYSRQFVVQWIQVLNDIPSLNMVACLPCLLDGLYKILVDPVPQVRKSCENLLGDLLKTIKQQPTGVQFGEMTDILVIHLQSNSEQAVQFIAVQWLHIFLKLSGKTLLGKTSGILLAILPCLSYDDTNSIHHMSASINDQLMLLIDHNTRVANRNSSSRKNLSLPVEHETSLVNNAEIPPSETAETQNETEGPKGDSTEKDKTEHVDRLIEEETSHENSNCLQLTALVDVLCSQALPNTHLLEKVAVLRWFLHLFVHLPTEMRNHITKVLPVLLKLLLDPTDEVKILDLEVLAEISSLPPFSPDRSTPAVTVPHFNKKRQLGPNFQWVLTSLLDMFKSERRLLEHKGQFIFRQICAMLGSEDVYKTIATILHSENDVVFVSTVVQTLNALLLTSTELHQLRIKMNSLETKDACDLFECLYRCWCHNPAATLCLCLLSQSYEHASLLISKFGQVEITEELLAQFDLIVQLIESPVFTYLRLQLLEPHYHPNLVYALYGLLMLLPQSEAFSTLKRRLECIPSITLPPANRRKSIDTEKANNIRVDYDSLSNAFDEAVATRNRQKNVVVLSLLSAGSKNQLVKSTQRDQRDVT